MFFRTFGQIGWFIVYFFAVVGFVLTSGFLALRFGWTNTAGVVDPNDRYFREAIGKVRQTQNLASAQAIFNYNCQILSKDSYAWLGTSDWLVLKEAIIKDQAEIKRASDKVGIPPRLLVSLLVGEQLRLYTSEREVFKQIFQPLKILGVQSKFSWGVMGLKEETAKQIETNLKDKSSLFYLGAEFEGLLDFETADYSAERFARLTDSHDHYYSYLYSAIYLRQIMRQWQVAGYDISQRPEILATLFNLGFAKSVPKVEPQVGGAEIEVGGEKYSFGGLAFQFYYSGELIDYFPWQ